MPRRCTHGWARSPRHRPRCCSAALPASPARWSVSPSGSPIRGAPISAPGSTSSPWPTPTATPIPASRSTDTPIWCSTARRPGSSCCTVSRTTPRAAIRPSRTAFRVAAALRDEDPEAFAVLTRVPFEFRFRDSDYDIRHRWPLIRLGEDGEAAEIRFNIQCMHAPAAVGEEMATVYRAYRKFAALIDDARFKLRFRLAPGEVISFDNSRVVAWPHRLRRGGRPPPAGASISTTTSFSAAFACSSGAAEAPLAGRDPTAMAKRRKLRKLLVANRSEIAIRIFRAGTELGLRTVGRLLARGPCRAAPLQGRRGLSDRRGAGPGAGLSGDRRHHPRRARGPGPTRFIRATASCPRIRTSPTPAAGPGWCSSVPPRTPCARSATSSRHGGWPRRPGSRWSRRPAPCPRTRARSGSWRRRSATR